MMRKFNRASGSRRSGSNGDNQFGPRFAVNVPVKLPARCHSSIEKASTRENAGRAAFDSSSGIALEFRQGMRIDERGSGSCPKNAIRRMI